MNSDQGVIKDEDGLQVTQDGVTPESEVTSKEGTFVTTSSYRLEGSFTLSANGEDVILEVGDDSVASTSLPDLYVYLTNNPNSVNGALEVGPVEIFEGEHSYTISDVGLNDFSHLLYWCKPFTIKVGEGEIKDTDE